jgi:hypothetical protein
MRDPKSLEIAWRGCGITTQQMAEAWPKWVSLCDAWLSKVFSFWSRLGRHDAFKDLMKMLVSS